jgi:predicted DNA-binding WGR domain protein
MTKRYFEYNKKSHKFWKIDVSNNKVAICFGTVGTDGKTSIKEFRSSEEAQKYAEKMAAVQIEKNYKEMKLLDADYYHELPLSIKESVDLIIAGLENSHCKSIVAHYHGSRDDGYITGIEITYEKNVEIESLDEKRINANLFRWIDSKNWEATLSEQTVTDALTELFSIILDNYHSGFGNDAGGHGCFTWNLQNRKCFNSHHMRMREYAWEANAIYMPEPDIDEDDALEWGWDEGRKEIKISDLPKELQNLHKNDRSTLRNAVIGIHEGDELLEFRVTNTHIIFNEPPNDSGNEQTPALLLDPSLLEDGSYYMEFNL